MRPHSDPFLSFLAYYMGAPSEQFLRINYGGPLRSVYSLNMEASILMYFFHTIWGPLGSFFCILYWGSQITFFAYYMGPLWSVSSHTIWGPFSDHFHCLLYAPPQISFFACYRGATSDFIFFTKYMAPPPDQFLRLLYGAPQVSFFAYYMGPHQISFCVYFLGAPLRSVFSLTIWGPLRSGFSHTIWGGPSDQFLRLLYGGPLRSVSSFPI